MSDFISALINSIAQSMATMFGKWLTEKLGSNKRAQIVLQLIFISCFVITMFAMWYSGQNR